MIKKKKYTFFGVLKTWAQLVSQAALQWHIFVVYATVITAISALFGRWSYSCQHGSTGYWCMAPSGNQYLMIAFFAVFYLLMFYITGSFVSDLHNGIFKNSVFKAKDMFLLSKQKIKTTLALFKVVFIVVFCTSVAIYLIRRPANPDFRIEFFYFLIIFALLLIPLFMMRCAACLAYYLNNGHYEFAKVYDATSGRSYVSMMSFLLLTVFILVLNIRMIAYFGYLAHTYNYLVTAFLTDFGDTLIKLVCLAAYLMLFQAQYLRMQEETELSAEIPADNDNKEAVEPEVAIKTAKHSPKALQKKKYKRKSKNAKADTEIKTKKGKS